VLIVVENLELCENDTINFLSISRRGCATSASRSSAPRPPQLAMRHTCVARATVAPVMVALGALAASEAEELLRELCKQLSDALPRSSRHVRGSRIAARDPGARRFLARGDVIAREGVMWRIDAAHMASTPLPRPTKRSSPRACA